MFCQSSEFSFFLLITRHSVTSYTLWIFVGLGFYKVEKIWSSLFLISYSFLHFSQHSFFQQFLTQHHFRPYICNFGTFGFFLSLSEICNHIGCFFIFNQVKSCTQVFPVPYFFVYILVLAEGHGREAYLFTLKRMFVCLQKMPI